MSVSELEAKLKEKFASADYIANLDEFEKDMILPLAATLIEYHKKLKQIQELAKETDALFAQLQDFQGVLSTLDQRLNDLVGQFADLKARQEEREARRAELQELERTALTKLIQKFG